MNKNTVKSLLFQKKGKRSLALHTFDDYSSKRQAVKLLQTESETLDLAQQLYSKGYSIKKAFVEAHNTALFFPFSYRGGIYVASDNIKSVDDLLSSQLFDTCAVYISKTRTLSEKGFSLEGFNNKSFASKNKSDIVTFEDALVNYRASGRNQEINSFEISIKTPKQNTILLNYGVFPQNDLFNYVDITRDIKK